MDNLITALLICLAVPMLLSLVLLDKKSRVTIGFLIIGFAVCYYCAGLNAFLANLSNKDITYITTTLTPMVEETMKALPILLFACLFSDDRKVLITISAAIGICFSILENSYNIINLVEITSIPWALMRTLGAGLMHSICTIAVGFGISFVRKKKKLFICGTFALLVAAITYHGVYNLLVQTPYWYAGIIMTIATYLVILIVIIKNNKLVKKEKES